MINKFGNDFTRSYSLNLMPWVYLHPGYLHTVITTADHHCKSTAYNQSAFNHGNKPSELDCIVGQDVYLLHLVTGRHGSFPAGPSIHYSYNLRVDRLIFLNIACKLLNFKPVP